MASRWYILHSKPNSEGFLFEQLRLRAIETYHPCIRTHAINPRARKIKPLFPGYLFIHIDLDRMGKSCLEWIPGASGLVSFGGEPGYVPDNLIHALQKRVEQIQAIKEELRAEIKRGEKVVIREGPFQGYEAVFDMRISGSERVRVLLQLFRDRQVSLQLRADQILRPQYGF